jgi:hypothetical protein
MNAEQPRVLRTRPWLAIVVVVANALFLAGAASSYRETQWSPAFIGFALLSVVGVLGILELAVSRIVLRDNILETRDLFSRRQYQASTIRSVKWEGGSGVSVELVQGGWAKLPELGYNSQSLTNTLRAWLKRCRKGGE